jgi:predicted porin
LNAIFTLEGGFAIDTGTTAQTGTNAGSRLFGRQAWAGLQGGWGAVVAGRIALLSSGTGSFDIFGNVDPYLTGFGDSGLQNTFSSANALRVDNAVGYVSPTFAGFKGGVMYSFNVDGAEVAGGGNNTRALDMGLSWTWGNLYVVGTYDLLYLPNCQGTQTQWSAACGSSNQTHLQLGATYDFKVVKLHGAWAQEKNQRLAQSRLAR